MADNGNGNTIKINWMKLLTWALTALLVVSWYVAEGYIGRVHTLESKVSAAELGKLKDDKELALILQSVQTELKQMRIDNGRMDSLIWIELKKQ